MVTGTFSESFMEEVASGLTLREIWALQTSLCKISMLSLYSWTTSDGVRYLQAAVGTNTP